MKCKSIKQLKKEIEIKRNNLNKIVLEEKEKEKVIRFSQELDTLIKDYYLLNKERKVADI